MRIYIFAIVVILGMALFVARQDEWAAQERAQKAADRAKTVIPAIADEKHPQKNIEDTTGNTPSWLGFFRWPTGTTTLALILTLIVVAEQTKQTTKAAEAARDSAKAALKQADHMVASERAWMIAKMEPVKIPDISEHFPFGIIPRIVNGGKTPAFIVETGSEAVVLGYKEHLPIVPVFNEKHISRWEGRGLPLAPSGHIGRFAFCGIPNPSGLYQLDTTLWVYGYVKYRDVFDSSAKGDGIVRETRFCFRAQTPLLHVVGDMTSFIIDGTPTYNEAT
jgi:hypothetical protein